MKNGDRLAHKKNLTLHCKPLRLCQARGYKACRQRLLQSLYLTTQWTWRQLATFLAQLIRPNKKLERAANGATGSPVHHHFLIHR